MRMRDERQGCPFPWVNGECSGDPNFGQPEKPPKSPPKKPD